MFNHARLLRGMAAFGMAACLAFPTMAHAADVDQTVTVTEENHESLGWDVTTFGNADIDFDNQIANSPVGEDAAEMRIGSAGMGVALLTNTLYACNRLGDLGPVSYWTYVESD